MSTVINAETPKSTQQASVCSNIHDLTGTLTSDPATWPDYGVKSLVRGPQCSLADRGAQKGSRVRWRVWKGVMFWIALPSDGPAFISTSWKHLMEDVNAEIARRSRSKNLGG